jgi:6-phosphogluconolactonase/glucosamine-6-phosphate isomerase/deaminase
MISTVSSEEVVIQIVAKIAEEATRKPVLFLISGGSVLPAVAEIIAQLEQMTLPHIVTIGQVDERYGLVGHADSNWRGLLKKNGEIHTLTTLPILQGAGFEETVDSYEQQLHNLKDCSIGAIFGVGLDSHTAGILPHSPAALEEEQWVAGYQANDYTRVTVTPGFIRTIAWAYLYAQGPQKLPILEALEQSADPIENPVQFLKRIPNLTILHTP